MKLAACYTVFDGLELLYSSVLNIIPFVDMVVICYQNVSHTGNVNNDIAFTLDAYVNQPDVHLVRYQTDLQLTAKENERRKHNLMISKAREQGASHAIMMATDHFYTGEQVFNAKRIVEEKGYDSTFTGMYTYYKKPTWQLTPIETYYMPFIFKLYPETKIEKVRMFPVFVDPSVQMTTYGKWYMFQESECMLHHYSMVRKDVLGKFQNAASPWTKEQMHDFTDEFNRYTLEENPGISYFKGRKVKVVDDYFRLNTIFEPDTCI